MSADVLDLGERAARIRGRRFEAERRRRIAERRSAAFGRAAQDNGRDYGRCDVALFGPREQLLREGLMLSCQWRTGA